MANPRPSLYKQQSKVLAELKSYPKSSLRHVQAIRVTDTLGQTVDEPWAPLVRAWSGASLSSRVVSCGVRLGRHADTKPLLPHLLSPLMPLQPLQSSLHSAEEEAALRALAKLRLRAKQDDQPCRVVPGVFVGGAGAARNLKALRKRGITHIVNAAPAVPCHFADNPEGCFSYLALQLFDDPDAGGPCCTALVAARR
jgi:hypothetical protein